MSFKYINPGIFDNTWSYYESNLFSSGMFGIKNINNFSMLLPYVLSSNSLCAKWKLLYCPNKTGSSKYWGNTGFYYQSFGIISNNRGFIFRIYDNRVNDICAPYLTFQTIFNDTLYYISDGSFVTSNDDIDKSFNVSPLVQDFVIDIYFYVNFSNNYLTDIKLNLIFHNSDNIKQCVVDNNSINTRMYFSDAIYFYASTNIYGIGDIIISDEYVSSTEEIVPVTNSITTNMVLLSDNMYGAQSIGDTLIHTIDATDLLAHYGTFAKVTGICQVANPAYRTENEDIVKLISVEKSGNSIIEINENTLPSVSSGVVIDSYAVDYGISSLDGKQYGWKMGGI